LITVGRILHHQPRHQRAQLRRQVGADPPQLLGLLLDVLDRHVERRRPGERREAGEQVIARHPEAVQVAAVVHRLPLHLLRRHVQRGAQRHPALGQAERFLLAAEVPGQAEVRHLHFHLAGEEDVLRLDVAVDDAVVVGELQGIADLRDDGERLARRDAAAMHQRGEVHSVHELHQDVV
jgi:hypothetical protein